MAAEAAAAVTEAAELALVPAPKWTVALVQLARPAAVTLSAAAAAATAAAAAATAAAVTVAAVSQVYVRRLRAQSLMLLSLMSALDAGRSESGAS